MLLEHLGELIDADPKVTAFENVIIAQLRRRGPTRTRDLWVRTAGRRHGEEFFNSVVDGLSARGVIVRETTNRVNSFIYRMARDQRRRERAVAREEASRA